MSLFNLTFVGINVYIVPKKQDHKYIIQRHLIKCRKIRKWKKIRIREACRTICYGKKWRKSCNAEVSQDWKTKINTKDK